MFAARYFAPRYFAPRYFAELGAGLAVGLALTIASVDRLNGYYVPGTMRIARQIKGRATASFVIRDPAQSFRPARGTAVHASDGTTTFDGLIDSFTELRDANLDVVRFRVNCQDYSAAFDRRVVSRRYPAGTAASVIFADINTNFLDGEGFNVTNVNGFYVLADDLEFDFRTVTECFNLLCDLGGERWWTVGHDIYSKTLANSPSALFGLTDTSSNWADLEVDYPRSTYYRNVQHLRTGAELSFGAIVDSITAVAGQFFFLTTFPLNIAPSSITVNGTPQTIKEFGVDAYPGTGYYWMRGGNGVQEGNATSPGAGAVVVITYGSYSSSVVTARDDAQIAARAAIEGNSGKYEALDEARDVNTLDVANDLAAGILARFNALPTTIRYRTPQGGLKPGDKQTVNLTANGINATFYITQIDSDTIESITPFNSGAGSGQFFWHTVTLSSGQDETGWLKWWISLWGRVKGAGGSTSGIGRGLDAPGAASQLVLRDGAFELLALANQLQINSSDLLSGYQLQAVDLGGSTFRVTQLLNESGGAILESVVSPNLSRLTLALGTRSAVLTVDNTTATLQILDGANALTLNAAGVPAGSVMIANGSGPMYGITGTTQVIVLAKLTPGGANGSVAFIDGVMTGYAAPT